MKPTTKTRLAKFVSFTVLATLWCGAASSARAADYPSTVSSLNPVVYYRLNETAPPAACDTVTNIGSLGVAGNGLYWGDPSITAWTSPPLPPRTRALIPWLTT